MSLATATRPDGLAEGAMRTATRSARLLGELDRHHGWSYRPAWYEFGPVTGAAYRCGYWHAGAITVRQSDGTFVTGQCCTALR